MDDYNQLPSGQMIKKMLGHSNLAIQASTKEIYNTTSSIIKLNENQRKEM